MKGFTLLELLISIMILSFISLGVYQTTSSSFSLREDLEKDGDFYNSIRVALDIIGRDIAHMYSPQGSAFPGDIGKATIIDPAKPNEPKERSPYTDVIWPFWGGAINAMGVRPARFLGEATKMTFIANSNFRLFRDAPESDFIKVTYSYEEDTLAGRGTRALFRRTHTDVFTEREDSATEERYLLISRLKSLKFSFLDGEKDRWDMTPRWDTAEGLYKDVYPAMIRVEIEVFTPNSDENTFSISQLYRPELNL